MLNELMRQDDHDARWTVMAAAWQDRDELPRVDPEALRAAVVHETRRMRAALVLEAFLSIAALAGTIVNARRDAGFHATLVAVDTFAVLAIVWTFALWGRRGLWVPSAETSCGYLVLQSRRAHLRLMTTWLALALVAAQLVVLVVTGSGISILQVLAAAAWVVWALWMRVRAGRELRYYDALSRQVSGE